MKACSCSQYNDEPQVGSIGDSVYRGKSESSCNNAEYRGKSGPNYTVVSSDRLVSVQCSLPPSCDSKLVTKNINTSLLQVDGEVCSEDASELLDACKEYLKNLLNDKYDKFEILALASKFNIIVSDELSFSRQKYLLQLKVLENILKEDQSDYYRRIQEETLRIFSYSKPKGFSCCLIGCLFSADRHRNYVKHLQLIHPSHNKISCNFDHKCKRVVLLNSLITLTLA